MFDVLGVTCLELEVECVVLESIVRALLASPSANERGVLTKPVAACSFEADKFPGMLRTVEACFCEVFCVFRSWFTTEPCWPGTFGVTY